MKKLKGGTVIKAIEFDNKFKENKLRYIGQCLLASICVFIIILLLDSIFDAAIIAAFGATSFIVFTMPTLRVSKTNIVIGGYIVGILAGLLCHILSIHIGGIFFPEKAQLIFGAFAVGITMFIMVITNTEHPPAAAVSLGLVTDGFNIKAVSVIVIGVLILLIMKRILRKFLIDLI